MDKETWYKLRDDRTKRIDDAVGFEDIKLGFVVDDRIHKSYSTQVMTLLSLNMAARWCQNITIQIPKNVTSAIPRDRKQDFIEILQKEITKIDPFGDFRFQPVDSSDVDCILSIGCLTESINEIWIDANGWLGGIGTCSLDKPSTQIEYMNPIGPAFSACLGNAELFRRAIGFDPATISEYWYSLYDLKSSTDKTTLSNPHNYSGLSCGHILQVGCGAVGSSLNYLQSLTTFEHEITLVDYDTVEISNLNRSLAFNANDAIQHKSKVDKCACTLSDINSKISRFQTSFKDYISTGKYIDQTPDIVLCLANEQNIWSDIQNNYPPIVLHATTTPNWGINFGRHIPKKEWCIMCRFSNEIDNSFTPVCSEVEIKKEETPVLGVLPFLSPTAAVLVLAELGKMSTQDFPVNNNFIQYTMKTTDSQFISYQRSADKSCICQDQDINDYPEEIKTTKYWSKVD